MTGQQQFVVLALPRSRTAWLAHYLGYAGRRVGHDIAIECASIEDFLGSFERGMTGTVETGAVIAWRLMLEALPSAKFVVVTRPLEEIYSSLARLGVRPIPGELESRAELLAQACGHLRVESVAFRDLADPQCARWLFEYCLDLPWDEAWHDRLARLNIQVDIEARMRQLTRNAGQLAGLQAEIARRTRTLSHGLH
jgi:hypothetical protein